MFKIEGHEDEAKPMVPICPFCLKEVDRLVERRIGAAGSICYVCPHCKKILGVAR